MRFQQGKAKAKTTSLRNTYVFVNEIRAISLQIKCESYFQSEIAFAFTLTQCERGLRAVKPSVSDDNVVRPA